MRLTESKLPLNPPVRALRILAAAAILLVSPVRGADPPANRTYFTILLGLDGKHSWHADCLDFSKTGLCTSGGDCGTWTQTEPGLSGAFSFEIRLGDEEDPMLLEGRMRFETRGQRDAIGGVARGQVDGQVINLALTGRPTSRRDCSRLLEQWEAGNQ